MMLHLNQYRLFKRFKSHLRILRFAPSVFNNFWHLTIAAENLFFSGFAWQDFLLELRASYI
jgi:hypothetical protein